MLEGTFRSLNNLLERFHQSFFFYLLPATNRYISISVYMPPFGMVTGPLLIMALALWFQISQEEEQDSSGTVAKSGEGKKGVWCYLIFTVASFGLTVKH